jgi:pimeloyl-ACP methyl ester carboxylesterase
MPQIRINNLEHYFEQTGQGPALVLVHGAFADARVWEPQWGHFSTKYQLLRYDLRGHGKTGASDMARYSVATYVDDLSALLDALEIRSPILCGLSWGGSIVQAFAVRYPERPKALILAGSVVSISLTFLDKLLCYMLFPRWMMFLTIRMMSVENFTRFSFRLARLTRGKYWLSKDESVHAYLEQCMLRMDSSEYLKIWAAIYGFHSLPLEKITCPTLILNGEYEPKNTFRHTDEILHRAPQAKSRVIPGASHAMNLEQAETFNKFVDTFLDGVV